VLDCTGSQNLSNPTHQETKEMCWIVQEVGILEGFILGSKNTLRP
jgi:hypothetical protein